jgi:Rha family phage regulatory protein
LRDIDLLLRDLPADFGRLHFELSSYLNSQNKVQPLYRLTRDGFSLLAMGFTGKPALNWKIRYIGAFNQMEQALQAEATRQATRQAAGEVHMDGLDAPLFNEMLRAYADRRNRFARAVLLTYLIQRNAQLTKGVQRTFKRISEEVGRQCCVSALSRATVELLQERVFLRTQRIGRDYDFYIVIETLEWLFKERSLDFGLLPSSTEMYRASVGPPELAQHHPAASAGSLQ